MIRWPLADIKSDPTIILIYRKGENMEFAKLKEKTIMNMPKPVYESLPTLYVVGGIAAISTVDSFMSFISGILLGCSGVVIMFIRRDYRQTNTDK